MKKKVMMLSCIAAYAIVSGYVGMKAYESHAYEKNIELLSEDVEALSTCEGEGGYPMGENCIECPGKYCFQGEFTARNCISNLV
jgi:hypothetical protein